MRYLTLAAAAILSLETAAIACSCINTDDPVELRRLAGETAKDAVALVEVEVVRPYDRTTGEGETMRVVRVLAGNAPASFRVPRTHPPSSASCDIDYRARQRDEVILYPATGSAPSSPPAFRTSGLCSDHLLDKPEFRNTLIMQLQARSGRGERG